MAAPKRSAFQVEADRAAIATLYLQGQTQHLIAQRLGISRAMVTYDLRVIQRRWRAETVRNLDEYKARELDKIDNLERTYWEAWERSLETRETSTTSMRAGVAAAFLHKEPRDGNPAFLVGVQWCIDRRCKLLMLDPQPAPPVVTVDNREVHITVTYDDDVRNG